MSTLILLVSAGIVHPSLPARFLLRRVLAAMPGYRFRPMPHVRFCGARVRRARPPVWGGYPLQRSLEAFRAWVVEERPYLTPAQEFLPVLAAIEAIYRSAQSGQRQRSEFADRRQGQVAGRPVAQ